MKNEKVAINARKVKAIALPFCCLFAIDKNEISREKWAKSKGYIALHFCFFLPFMKNG